MVSAYGATPINLSCSVVGFTLGGVRIAVPAGLACGFNNTLTSTTTSVQFSSHNTGFISQSLYVGAARGYTIASNTAPPQPATRWWIAGGGTTLACIFLLGLPARRRKWQSLLGVCVMVIVSFGMSGCGATVAPGPGQQYSAVSTAEILVARQTQLRSFLRARIQCSSPQPQPPIPRSSIPYRFRFW